MRERTKPLKLKSFLSLIIQLVVVFSIPLKANANYWLVIGSYRQGPGVKPHVSGITSPSLYAIPIETLKQCEEAGRQISNDIYKPVWQFDNRWTCVYKGKTQG